MCGRLVITSSAQDISEHFGAVVVAEGIETETQLACVETAGVDYVQGWLFSRATLAGQVAPGWGPSGQAPCTCWA